MTMPSSGQFLKKKNHSYGSQLLSVESRTEICKIQAHFFANLLINPPSQLKFQNSIIQGPGLFILRMGDFFKS